jgi:hypothetical protein
MLFFPPIRAHPKFRNSLIFSHQPQLPQTLYIRPECSYDGRASEGLKKQTRQTLYYQQPRQDILWKRT